MSNYNITTPQSYSNKAVSDFLSNFYKLSDLRPPAENDPYVDQFLPDAYVKIGPLEGLGHKDITNNRQKMWVGIEKRKHTVFEVYPFTKDTEETQNVAIYGEVEYAKSDGSSAIAEWAGRFIISVKDGVVKGVDYRVFVGPQPTLKTSR